VRVEQAFAKRFSCFLRRREGHECYYRFPSSVNECSLFAEKRFLCVKDNRKLVLITAGYSRSVAGSSAIYFPKNITKKFYCAEASSGFGQLAKIDTY